MYILALKRTRNGPEGRPSVKKDRKDRGVLEALGLLGSGTPSAENGHVIHGKRTSKKAPKRTRNEPELDPKAPPRPQEGDPGSQEEARTLVLHPAHNMPFGVDSSSRS